MRELQNAKMTSVADNIKLDHPVFFFPGYYGDGNNKIKDIPLSELEVVDVEVSTSDDEEISISDYDVIQVDEYLVENQTDEKNQVNSSLQQSAFEYQFGKIVQEVDTVNVVHPSQNVQSNSNMTHMKAMKYKASDKTRSKEETNSFRGKPPDETSKRGLMVKCRSSSHPSKCERRLKNPGKHSKIDVEVAKWLPHLECMVCRCFCSNFRMLKLHFRHVHPAAKFYAVCCGCKFGTRWLLVNHIRSRHFGNSKEDEPLVTKTEELEEFIEHYIPIMQCSICNAKCAANFSTLENHFKIKHPKVDCAIVCCQHYFRNVHSIFEHILVHLDPNTFKCVLCKKLYLTKFGLDRHMLNEHYVSKCPISLDYNHPYISDNNKSIARRKYDDLDNFIAQWKPALNCTLCSLRFLTFTSLKEHFRQSHPNDECCVWCCGSQLKNRHTFEEHIHLHNDPTGFECCTCFDRFKSRSWLYDHMREKHPLIIHKIQ